jgi:pimeloyl-ACP methyl ester carboxylesterase
MTEIESVRHGFVNANGLRVHYVDFGGAGSPIACVHGVTGHAWIWHDAARDLREIGRVVAVDLRGHGDSQWSADAAYSTEDHVADLGAVIEALGWDSVDVIGSSWGGLVALGLAMRLPEIVRRIAIVDVEPSFDQDEFEVPPRPRMFRTHDEVVAWEREANPRAPAGMIEIVAQFSTRPAEGGRLVRKHDPFFFERWPFRSDDHWDELRKLAIPTLVVHGELSFVRGEVAERMAYAARGTLVHVRSGHVIPVDNPQGLGHVLGEFFRQTL